MKPNAVTQAAVLDQDLPVRLEHTVRAQLAEAQRLRIDHLRAKLKSRHLGPLGQQAPLLSLLLRPIQLPQTETDKKGNQKHEKERRDPAKTKIQVAKLHMGAIFLTKLHLHFDSRATRFSIHTKGYAMEFMYKLPVLIVLGFIIFSLGEGMYFLAKDDGDINKTRVVKALTIRIVLSLTLFALLILGYFAGVLQPHGG